ncbi:hypothetical protein ES705_28822 [subsurface metagenome]
MMFGVKGKTQEGETKIIVVKAGSSQAAFEKAEATHPGFRPEAVVSRSYSFQPGDRRARGTPPEKRRRIRRKRG